MIDSRIPSRSKSARTQEEKIFRAKNPSTLFTLIKLMRDTTMEYIFLEHIEIYHKLSKYWNYIEAGMNLSSSSD